MKSYFIKIHINLVCNSEIIVNWKLRLPKPWTCIKSWRKEMQLPPIFPLFIGPFFGGQVCIELLPKSVQYRGFSASTFFFFLTKNVFTTCGYLKMLTAFFFNWKTAEKNVIAEWNQSVNASNISWMHRLFFFQRKEKKRILALDASIVWEKKFSW